MVRGDAAETDAGVTRYAVETLAARTYWLGEGERLWPSGYAHDSAGIVWGGKTDFATFFDGRPEAVLGIQLLPVTFGSLYRADADGALRRWNTIAAASGGMPRLWPDLFVMDLGLTDPARALAMLDDDLTVEPGNSRALMRYWLLALDRLGPPRRDLIADQPIGLAFGRGRPVLAAVNPTDVSVTVRWRDPSGRAAGELSVPAGQAATQR
jgi:endoglucanase Acf2